MSGVALMVSGFSHQCTAQSPGRILLQENIHSLTEAQDSTSSHLFYITTGAPSRVDVHLSGGVDSRPRCFVQRGWLIQVALNADDNELEYTVLPTFRSRA